MNLLVMGGSGFVGARLVRRARADGYSVSYSYKRGPVPLDAEAYRVDLLTGEGLEPCLYQTQPNTVIYAAVAMAGTSDKTAQLVNTEGVTRTLELLEKVNPNARFVYLSSNAVFSGKDGPYSETAVPDPEAISSVYKTYGLTKRGGEVVTATRENHLIIRTATVDGPSINGQMSGRLANLTALLRAGEPFKRFSRRCISPTFVGNLTKAVLETVAPGFDYRGVLHVAGQEQLSDFHYAQKLARHLGLNSRLVEKDETPQPNTCLDVTFTQDILKTRLLEVDEGLESSGIT